MSRNRNRIVLLILIAGLVFGGLVYLYLGAVSITAGDIGKILLSKLPGVDLFQGDECYEQIILMIRVPRMLTALLVGAALAIAGVIFQAVLRNPLADPYIIGTSAGAGLGASIAFALGTYAVWFRFSLVSLFAFIGAVVVAFLVYNIARVGKGTSVTTLILAGFAIGAMLSGIIHFLMLINERSLLQISLWLMGSVSSTSWEQLAVAAPVILIGITVACFFTTDLDALLLGDEQAAHIGLNVERSKLLLIMLGSLIVAVAVSISGLIGFVGLVAPHVTRILLGPGHRLLVPTSALLGALLLMLADLGARMVLAPAEIPVGIVTAIVGTPFFIYLLRQRRREYSLQ